MRASLPVLLCTALLLAACGQGGGPQGPGGPPPVTVAKPLKKEVQEWDEYTGRFAAVNSVEVRARVSGYLNAVSFRDGQIVRKGDPLFEIDPRPFQVALDGSTAQLAAAQARLDLANRELQRAQDLRGRGTIPQAELDAKAAAVREATAAIAVAQAGIAQARLDLEFAKVSSPIAGRISRPLVTVGNLVSGGSGQGTLLTTIVSLDPIHFYFDVDEQAYLRYTRLAASGQRPSSRDQANPVELKLADEKDFTHKGAMDFVDNQIDRSTGTLRGRAIFANLPIGPASGQVLFAPGQFAKIRLLGSGKYDGLLLPDSAIGADQAARIVFVVDGEGTVRPRPVVVGPLVDGMRVIREGIGPDDVVVINGLMRVRPGSKVTPQMVDLAAAAVPDPAAPPAEEKK